MLTLLLMLIGLNANAFESGDAPFCTMDNNGNLQCYYYDMSSCYQAARQANSHNQFDHQTCIRKPN